VVQVPPDGHPIVLLADAQTLGGYPQLAHVVSADLPRMAQVRPGETVRFEEVTLGQARELARQRRRELGLVRLGLEAAGVEFLGKEGGE
jgi:antagonist of KipI